MRQRGVRRGSKDDAADDRSGVSASASLLNVIGDDCDNLTDCEEFYDDEVDCDSKQRPHHSPGGEHEQGNDEWLTDIEYSSSDDDEPSSTQPDTSTRVTRRSARELSLYIQRVLGRPLRAVSCFKEREHCGALIQTEQVDYEEEEADDENSHCDDDLVCADPHESSPDSAVSDIEASDFENSDNDMDNSTRSCNNAADQDKDSNIIDNYLQGHFARLSSTDNDARGGRRESEIDDSHLAPGIVVSNYGELSTDASHPVTEEEILSEREAHNAKPIHNRVKRRVTRGQFSKQSNYLTASLPTVGQGETDSDSESDGRQVIRSSDHHFKPKSISLDAKQTDDDVSPEAYGGSSNLPSTDSESFELEDEDDASTCQ